MKKYNIFECLLEYIYPQNIKCMACQNPIPKTNPYSLCKNCFTKMIFVHEGCSICGKNLPRFYKEEKCIYCKEHKYKFNKAMSCIVYDEIAHKIIDRFKYKDKTYIGFFIAQIMKDKISYEDIDDFEYVIPVPIHKKRRVKRGYNQSEIIAKHLCKMINKKMIIPIDRVKNTKPLHSLNKLERLIELKNSFKENGKIGYIKGKNILIIDDIFTSGSTNNVISDILIKNKVNKVYVLCFASGMNMY